MIVLFLNLKIQKNACTLVSHCCLAPIKQCLSNIMREQVNFHWDDDDVCFILDQHAELDFYGVNSLKQESADRHVAPLGHIILIPSQPVFALSPQCCVLSREATNTNLIVFGLTRPRLEPTVYHTRGEHANHYATDAVCMYITRLSSSYTSW